jgi:hypothetical protein
MSSILVGRLSVDCSPGIATALEAALHPVR